MKIKNIKINRFKRFTDLSVREIPHSIKLVLLVGPNGSGKTSLFEAFNHWYMIKGNYNNGGDKSYFEKFDGINELPSE